MTAFRIKQNGGNSGMKKVDVGGPLRPKKRLLPKAKGQVYLIQKVGWEYNDEYYYRPENGAGSGVVVFENEDEAERECERLNKRERQRIRDSKYGREMDWYMLPNHDLYADGKVSIDEVPYYEVIKIWVGEGPY